MQVNVFLSYISMVCHDFYYTELINIIFQIPKSDIGGFISLELLYKKHIKRF
jgi:hypothetical protein